MSAIGGVVSWERSPAAAAQARSIIDAMAHRGDDGIAFVGARGAVLGHRTRLTRVGQQQTFESEKSRIAVVLDGHLHNAAELRRSTGASSCGDAELIARSYEHWGEAAVDRLVGEFAFALWDDSRELLLAACDPAGVRQVAYCADGPHFAFASEVAPLAANLGRAARLNEAKLLRGLVDDDCFLRPQETIYEEIAQLPGGHALVAAAGRVRTWRYWQPECLPPLGPLSIADCAEGLRTVLEEAVTSRVEGAVRPGAMLSGGLDSSMIVCLASRAGMMPAECFTLLDAANPQLCADGAAVCALASAVAMRSHTIGIDVADDVFARFMRESHLLDEPLTWLACLPSTFVLEEAARNGRRTMLEGMAGDLLFYGTTSTWQAIARRRLLRQIGPFLTGLRTHGIRAPWGRLALRFAVESSPEKWRSAYHQVNAWLRPRPDGFATHLTRFRHHVARDYAQRRRSEPAHLVWSPEVSDGQVHADRFLRGILGFAHQSEGLMAERMGIEQRSPFSDRRVLEYAIRMPLESKLFSGWYKQALRLAIEPLAPPQVTWRRDAGRHPGLSHMRRLIARWRPTRADEEFVTAHVERWICADRLRSDWQRLRARPSYELAYGLFQLDRLARWLHTRSSSIRMPL